MRAPLPADHDLGPLLSRRSVLLGAAGLAGAATLAACSSPATTATGSGGSGGNGGGSGGTAKASSLIAVFDSSPAFSVAGKPQRFAFAVAGSDGVPLKDAPPSIDLTIAKLAAAPTQGQPTATAVPIGPPITVARHVDGVPIAYYPLVFTPDAPGYYQISTTLDGTPATSAIQVGDGSAGKVPQVGDHLISVDTPTTADHRGVEPICTRMPQMCSLHDVDLTDALQAGQPIALLISTPEFCQIGVCGPVLELLLEQHAKLPQYSMVHAEVYKSVDPQKGISSAELAPAVQAYNLTYEPALFVASADGTIVARLDNVFDRAEIADALAKAA